MCKLRRVSARALAALAALLLAGPVGAQQAQPTETEQQAPATGAGLEPGPTDAELEQRIDSLLPLVKAAAQELARARAEEKAARERLHPLDSARIGPFLVVAHRSQVEEARRVIAEAWAYWAPVAGDAAALLAGDVVAYRRTGEPRLRVAAPPGGRAWRVEVWGWPGERAGLTARDRVGEALASRLPERVRAWAGAGLSGGAPERAYRQLLTAPSTRARECFLGDDAACLPALGLTEGPEAPLGWYTPDELRAAVRSMPAGFSGGPARAQRSACLSGADRGACARVADGRARWALIPVGAAARRALLMDALRAGGPGAYTRLVEAGDVPVREALTLTAGRPVESVVPSWRSGLLAQRPQRSGGARGPAAALAWTVLFGALALRRRT